MRYNFDKVLDSLRNYIESIDSTIMKEDKREEDGNQISLSEIYTEEKPVRSYSESFERIIDALEETKMPFEIIPYSEITFLIYNQMNEKKELLDDFDGRLLSDFKKYKMKNDLNEDVEKRFLKVKEHISLSIIQRNHISQSLSDRIANVDEKLEESEEIIGKFSNTISNLEEETQKKVDRLVPQFIAILGIFAAIMMGTMGSFQGFTSIFSNAEKIPLGKILIISAAGASGVSLILFLLIHAIAKLTSISLSNCNCEHRKKGFFDTINDSFRVKIFGEPTKQKCDCSLFDKYPTIFIINYLLYFIAVTGFLFMYFNFKGYFGMNHLKHWSVIINFYLLTTIVLIFIHRYLIDKKPNEKSLYKLVKDIKRTPSYIKGAFKK